MLYGNRKKIVTNDIKVGGKYKHCILLGGNGSGKSAGGIKATLMNTGIAISTGIAFATKIKIEEPPCIIIHHANPADKLVEGLSRFQAEVTDYQKLIEVLKKYSLPILIGLDETMQSTVPKEGSNLLLCELLRLDEFGNTSLIVSSHFRRLNDYCKKMNLNQFKFMSTEYKKGVGFTFKIKNGLNDNPASVYTLQDMNFDQPTFNKFIKILSEDPTYEFKHKLPGYRKKQIKRKIGKTLLWLFWLILLFGLLGAGFFFSRRFKINIKIETRERGSQK